MKKNQSLQWEADSYVPLKKIIRKMKITLFVVLISAIQIFATGVYSQNAKFNLKKENASIENILNVIENQSDFYFLYNGKLVDVTQKVTVSVENQSIENTLKELLKNTNISYKIIDRQVILSPTDNGNAGNNQQKPKAISGKVTDTTGATLPGVSVVVRGTTNGTITDVDGNYKLSNVAENAVIQFSFVGMKSEEVSVAGKETVDVILKEESIGIEEVVAVGYGTQKKADLTGAVASVKTVEILKSMPSTNISNTLQGSLAGVSVVSGSGDPSKEMTIRIRGVNSISSDSQPLVVIDGFIGGSLKSLNPSDIQSIEVLKDASATAIYGSQGANGVILVTTKTPSKDKMTVSVNVFGSLQTVYKYPDVLSPAEFANLANAYGQEYFPTMTTPQAPKVYFTQDQIKALENGTGGYNYVKAIFNDPAISQNYDLSISGGNDKTTYLASVRYAGSQGIIKKSSNDAVNYRLKIDNTLRTWLSTGLNVYGDYSKSQGPRIDSYEGLLQTAINWPTTAQPTNADGSFNNVFPIGGLAAYNPMGLINDNKGTNQVVNNNVQAYTEVRFTKNLKFRSQFGVTLNNSLDQNTFDSKSYFYFKNNRTQAYSTSAWNLSWLNTNILNYNKEFNKNHRINATAVFEQSYANFYNHQSTAELLAFDLGYDALAWADKYYVNSQRTIFTLMSGMGRINYVYRNRYMATVSYRADGSSRLKNKWDYFPSCALAWDLAQEEFMKRFKIINQLKLRTGYGVVGNQAITPYSIYSQMVPVANSDGTTSYTVGRPASPNLSWERNEQLNAGMDVAFWNGRLTVTADWYKKVSKDILLNVQQPAYAGWSSLLKNAGEITNTGFEVTVSADPVTGKTFSWHSDMTFTRNKGTYSVIPTPSKMQSMGVAGMANSPLSIFQMIEGQKIASFYGYTSEGIWKTNDVSQSVTIKNADGTTTTGTYASIYKVVPGQARIKDFNGDGKYDINDQRVIGCGQPAFNWGWNNTFKYKNFDMSLFIIGFHGFDIYNATDQSGYPNSLNGVAQDVVTPKRAFLNRWTKTNENTNIPGFVYISSPLQGFNSRFVEKGDFVKVKSITVGYNLPDQICKSLTISKLRVYASVQNPLMLTKYSGLDPEATLGNPLTSGVDWGNYPNGRNYIVGLSFSF